jgi:DNA-binding NarL/FixJ family response regulator
MCPLEIGTSVDRLFEETHEVISKTIMLRVLAGDLRRLASDAGEFFHQPESTPIPAALSTTKLTPREIGILQLIVDGNTSREIASRLGIAFKTVAAHRANIMFKLETRNCAALVQKAFRMGLVRVPAPGGGHEQQWFMMLF